MSILTKEQNLFLSLFSKDKTLSSSFYLTGGTALVEFYIPYRYSDDLDFFSESEVDTQSILSTIKRYKKQLNYKSIEFTYFPFPQIERGKATNGLVVDSPLDIAVNKFFTIYQKPRSRDFMDLYMLNKKYGYKIDELVPKVRSKFDWHVDLIKLGSQFMLATELKDYPKLLKPLEEKDWQDYFIKEAKKLGEKVLI